MPNTKTTIELNGKLYDALTGRLADHAAAPPKQATPTAPVAAAKPAAPKTYVDGVYRSPATKPRTARSQASAKRHAPQKASTLMRSAVSKPSVAPPATSIKPTTKSVSSSQPVASSKQLEEPNGRLQKRLERAAQVPKSSSVKRFSFGDHQSVNKRVEPLAVQPHPEQASQTRAGSAQAARQAVTEAQNSSRSPAAKIFSQELEAASSHRQAPVGKKTRLKASTKFAGAAIAVVLVGGFLAHHNMPTFSLKLADARAGFQASLPDYTPDGFALSRSVQAAPGEIVLAFRSNSDNRSYQLTQNLSDWSSSDLLSNFATPTYKQFQTVQSAGKTIYISGSNATWVSNGIWYRIKGGTDLSSQQLVKIIDSL